MKILVTGANGFLGSWIVKALLARGDQVRVLQRPNSDMTALKGLKYESCIGDVTEYQTIQQACEGIEVVFHVAAFIAYTRNERAMMEHVNVFGTENVVRAACEAKIKRLVHTSSVVAIGASLDGEILNEESDYEISEYDLGYFETKRRSEEIVSAAARSNQLDAVIVNPGVIFGPGDAVKGSRKVHQKVAAGKVPFYTHGGCNIIDVDDAVFGHLQALEKGRSGERYILGGENISNKTLFALLAQNGGHKAPWFPIPDVFMHTLFHLGRTVENWEWHLGIDSESAFLSTLSLWYDNSKACKVLGLNPKPASEAIRRSVEWSKKNHYLD